jgi:hypothetical protein
LRERGRRPEADGVAGERTAAGGGRGCGREGGGRRWMGLRERGRRPAAEVVAALRERGRRRSFGCVSWSGPMDTGLSKFHVHMCPRLLDRISSLSPHPRESSLSGSILFQVSKAHGFIKSSSRFRSGSWRNASVREEHGTAASFLSNKHMCGSKKKTYAAHKLGIGSLDP